ncbi:putative aspartyl aminopeptidase [Lachnospiraceae bacterium TWA4]|nr:putative aspartyl aminopeptidase [Lachnospiraceae bacterium TWA4]
MDIKEQGALLMRAIDKSVSTFHCVKYCEEQFLEEGFLPLNLTDSWKLEPGKGYFVEVFGSTLIGFRIPKDYKPSMPFHIAASHTDWPTLKIKPNPESTVGEYAKLNVEVYGGPIYSTWLDRPLSIAGRVAIKGEDYKNPEIRLVDFKRPVVTIPNLAIHFNREVNKGVEINAQKDLMPLLSNHFKSEKFFLEFLANELEVNSEDILTYDLNLYNMDSCALVGMEGDMLSAPHLDNTTSVQACVSGLIMGENTDCISVAALFDNEEIGSKTKQGADSVVLSQILEKIILSLGGTRETYLNSILGGLMLSADVAHATHPNHPEIFDITNKIYMGDGVAIKMHYGQRYATDAKSVGIIESICKEKDIPYVTFLNRSDLRGGSTLGSISSSILTMNTVDIGVAILAMHSARELMAIKDQEALTRIIAEIL